MAPGQTPLYLQAGEICLTIADRWARLLARNNGLDTTKDAFWPDIIIADDTAVDIRFMDIEAVHASYHQVVDKKMNIRRMRDTIVSDLARIMRTLFPGQRISMHIGSTKIRTAFSGTTVLDSSHDDFATHLESLHLNWRSSISPKTCLKNWILLPEKALTQISEIRAQTLADAIHNKTVRDAGLVKGPLKSVDVFHPDNTGEVLPIPDAWENTTDILSQTREKPVPGDLRDSCDACLSAIRIAGKNIDHLPSFEARIRLQPGLSPVINMDRSTMISTGDAQAIDTRIDNILRAMQHFSDMFFRECPETYAYLNLLIDAQDATLVMDVDSRKMMDVEEAYRHALAVNMAKSKRAQTPYMVKVPEERSFYSRGVKYSLSFLPRQPAPPMPA